MIIRMYDNDINQLNAKANVDFRKCSLSSGEDGKRSLVLNTISPNREIHLEIKRRIYVNDMQVCPQTVLQRLYPHDQIFMRV